MSNFIVGLSGGIGSGKTTVSDLFQRSGISVVDADIIARNVVKKGSDALTLIVNHFGQEYLTQESELDRAKLRTRIFSNESDKTWLNNLLHPLIRQQIIAALKQAPSEYCLLVAPLLLENQLEKLVDRVLIVDVNEATQIQRTLLRDSSNESEIQAIINSQISRKLRLQAADDIINNDNVSFDELAESVAKLHQKYLKMSQNVNK
ncbi:dephospho-CoA kinase [Thalassotalea profundi]|uniref:Dephospho-CoA kinase n=1 Tax=Thalassotalea profundi TaxID=2036687 RepID=A0ABQ3IWQ1_9GAMM|nr:dephospho-CoA kinase [Thalassotalea profundi]GHE95066.1 dephospho-CoA kinase [Thalassotalea profundi]